VKITGDISVLQGITLSIDTGTYTDSQGYYRINIAGSIRAIGTVTDTIAFTVYDTSGFWENQYAVAGGWGGFNISNSTLSADTSVFEYCKIQYGKKYGLVSEAIAGGAIKVSKYGALIIRNSRLLCNMVINHEYISMNGPVSRGGAIYCDSVNSVSVVHSTFERNRSYDGGGAIYIGKKCHPFISGNTFMYNKAWNSKLVSGVIVSWGSGAAIETYDTDGLGPTISGNYCFNNYTLQGIINSGCLEGIISNNLICNNVGVGIAAEYYFSMVRIFNNTIVNNDSHEGGIYFYCFPRIYNNIIWGNISYPGEITDQIQRLQGYPVLFNNCLQYGNGGSNSINSYPEFAHPSVGFGIGYNGAEADWSLKDNSPCINSGSTDTTGLFIPEYDIIGNPRIYGVRIEMGCYENQSVLTSIEDEPVVEIDPNIYPNPGTNYLIMESPVSAAIFELSTLTGQVMLSVHLDAGSNRVNTASLAPGIYFYKIISLDNQMVETGKWIKK
ncbi:MAG: T9SS type A sorting domain-containing protein, partial [Bacteroidota bacterium]